jgi:hypothetical protein
VDFQPYENRFVGQIMNLVCFHSCSFFVDDLTCKYFWTNTAEIICLANFFPWSWEVIPVLKIWSYSHYCQSYALVTDHDGTEMKIVEQYPGARSAIWCHAVTGKGIPITIASNPSNNLLKYCPAIQANNLSISHCSGNLDDKNEWHHEIRDALREWSWRTVSSTFQVFV